MKLSDMVQFVLDKGNLPPGDRRIENVIKTAINSAYMNFARIDCEPVEFEIEAPLQLITTLPDDFLVDLQLFHDALGSLNDYQYRVVNGKLIVAKHIINYDTSSKMTLLYGVKPSQLELDDDEPVLNDEYHMGLCYYALTEITEDPQYRYKYEDLLNSVPPFVPIINDNMTDEYIRDVIKR